MKNKVKLGGGSFATVYCVSENGQRYAVKVPHEEDPDTMKEIEICSELTESPFVAKFHGMCEIGVSKQIVFAFELCAMDLDQFYTIRDFGHKSSDPKSDVDHKSSDEIEEKSDDVMSAEREKFIECVIFCAENGLKYMHAKGFCHRDIKPENMLIGQDGNIKLTDHGFSKSIESIVKTGCGTETFMAPEVATNFGRKGKAYNGTLADQFSMGMTVVSFCNNIYVTISSEFNIDDDQFCNYPQMYKRIYEITNKVKNILKSPILKKFLNFTVKKNPKDRKGASFCLENCFPKDYTFERIKNDCKLVAKRFIEAKSNDPSIGVKGKNCCVCVCPFEMIKIEALMNSEDKSEMEEYTGGAFCDFCDGEINKGTLYHCKNIEFHGEPGYFDLCRSCVNKRNNTLKKNWMNGNAPIKNV